MKIAIINMVDAGSTGKIMLQIASTARGLGNEVKTFSKRWSNVSRPIMEHSFFGSKIEHGLHKLLADFTGLHGSFSVIGTHQLVRLLKKFGPDLISLHNLHDDCVNLRILFNYLKKENVPVVWTLHDCWAFTGRCPYFDITHCDKWKNECNKCPYPSSEYPKSVLDTSRFMYKKKKRLFSQIEKLTIVTPSKWLSNLVKDSFLKSFPIKVINNGIDLTVFRPSHAGIRERFNLSQDIKVVLGVAFGWNYRKGIDVFFELAKVLDHNYVILLVGKKYDSSQILPKNILTIERTNNQNELAAIYSESDVFVNPTREDNYPTVNMEALACGCPVITFDTGGSPEIIDSKSGFVIPANDIHALVSRIKCVCEENVISRKECLKRAATFSSKKRYEDYVALFEEVYHENHAHSTK